MTEPRTGPPNDSGQPGGSGPPPDRDPAAGPGPASTGQGNMGRMGEGNADPGITGASSTGGRGQEPAGSGIGSEPGHSGATSSGETSTGGTGTGGTDTAGSGVTTATRTSAAQATVPQQYGRQSERATEEGAMPGLGAGGGMMAMAAARSWPAVLVGGLGLIALGVMLFVWPSASLTLVAILIGAALLVSGLVRLYEGFTARAESGGMRAAYVVVGLLAVLAGLYCLRHHALSLFLVAFVTGVYFIVHGVADIGVALSAKVPGRALRGVLGVFSLGAGIVLVVWPAISLVLLFTIAGAWLLFYGLVLCGLAFSLFRASKRDAAGSAGSRSSRRLAASAG